MKTTLLKQDIKLILLVGFSILLLTNCQKPPTPDFSYSPTENPEAGDSIKFTNLSLEADTYSWDFGNSDVSNDENPFTIYEEAGSVEVTLTATNDAGSSSATQMIVINDPTVLGFIVFEEDGETVLPACEIWVYDNEYDYDQINLPQFFETTDSDGIALFLNLESQIYYIIAYKETETGVWFAGGSVPALTLNEYNLFNVPCTFFPNESTKSLLSRIRDLELQTLELNRSNPVN